MDHVVPAGGTDLRAAALYAALTEFERLAALAPLAPELADRLAVADAIGTRYQRLRAVLDRLGGAGEVPPDTSAAVDDARRRTATADWWEGLVAADLCGVLSDELFAALGGDAAEAADEAERVPGGVRAEAPVLSLERLRAALADDPVLAARLAMWGRRLAGESIVLARVFGAQRYPELADRLALAHASRLAELGLGKPAPAD